VRIGGKLWRKATWTVQSKERKNTKWECHWGLKLHPYITKWGRLHSLYATSLFKQKVRSHPLTLHSPSPPRCRHNSTESQRTHSPNNSQKTLFWRSTLLFLLNSNRSFFTTWRQNCASHWIELCKVQCREAAKRNSFWVLKSGQLELAAKGKFKAQTHSISLFQQSPTTWILLHKERKGFKGMKSQA
jgi:hypothetical protein